MNEPRRLEFSQRIDDDGARDLRAIRNLRGDEQSLGSFQFAKDALRRLDLREGERRQGDLHRRFLARLDLDLLRAVAQHLHADDRRTVLGKDQIGFREIRVILRDDQCTDAVAHTVDRHDRRILSLKSTVCILREGANSRL